MPPKSYLTLAHGDFRAMYGEIFLPQAHICGLKWVNVHPGNPARGLLTVMAKILLNEPDTGAGVCRPGRHPRHRFPHRRRRGPGGQIPGPARRLPVWGSSAPGPRPAPRWPPSSKSGPSRKSWSMTGIWTTPGPLPRRWPPPTGLRPGRWPRPRRRCTGMDIVVTTTPSTSPVVHAGVGLAGDPYQRHRRRRRRQTGTGAGDSPSRQGGGGRLGPGAPLRGNQRGPGPRGDHPGG